MKKILMLVVLMLVVASWAFAGNRYLPTDPTGPNYDRLQFVRDAKQLTGSATCYVVTLDTFSVTMIAENIDRERIEIVNLSTYTPNIMPCSSYSVNPTKAVIQANGIGLKVYSASAADNRDVWKNDIYVGKIAMVCDSAIAGMAGVTQKVLVVEYFKP